MEGVENQRRMTWDRGRRSKALYIPGSSLLEDKACRREMGYAGCGARLLCGSFSTTIKRTGLLWVLSDNMIRRYLSFS